MTAPRYQDIKSGEIPEVTDDDGTKVRIVVGDFWGKKGPVEGIAAAPHYIDVTVPPGKRKTLPVGDDAACLRLRVRRRGDIPRRLQAVRRCSPTAGGRRQQGRVRETAGNRSLVVFDTGDEVTVQAGDEGIRFLLVSGKPLKEPVAWYGPIVMNTKASCSRRSAS